MINKQLFFDLQVNGYGGVDFNQSDLKLEDIHNACEKLKDDGVQGILATIITNDIEEMQTCLTNIVNYRDQDPLVKELVANDVEPRPFVK